MRMTFLLVIAVFAASSRLPVAEGMGGYIRADIAAKINAPVYSLRSMSPDSIPRVVDYRDKFVTPVKDQGKCGSCWAHSAVEEVESMLAFQTGHVPPQPLSVEQVLVCCGDNISTCWGCMGGDMVVAYEYFINRSKGLDTSSDYPYDPHTDPFDPPKCLASTYKPVVKVTGWQYAVPRCRSGGCDENSKEKDMLLAAVVAEKGPVSIAMDMTLDMFHKYRGGISDGMGCSSAADKLDHGVQIVGYNLDAGYWLVRNSYGSTWGEQGYMRLTFGNNTCGLSNEATVVEVKPL